ncbi:nucleotidyltransferase domain-containing protein [Zavarzinia sp. CC-PAN008]|uniref:nucleotidyltransferase domain-containing protein n=1 Tax=Zavarzinia sp. CC-PAN008 TaxID=3243332 RepID=UPI003F74656F
MTDEAVILSRLRAGLADLYGDRIERVVLFGSRARGDAREDSDYDVALFLRDLGSRWDEVRRIVDLELAIRDDTGAFIHTMPFAAGAWRDPASPLMFEIRRDGRDL